MAAPKAAKPVTESLRYVPYAGAKKCSDCVQLVYEQLQAGGGSTHLIRTARVRRVARAGALLLCQAHAQHRRMSEAVPDTKGK